MSTPSIADTAAISQRGISFRVHGTPAPQGSKRAFVVGNRARVVEDSKKSAPWRDSVAAAGIEAMGGSAPLDGPLEVRVTFYMPRGKTVKREFPSVMPDVDKLARAVLDGLTAGGVLTDDARVVDLHAIKRYAGVGSALITVREVVS